MAKQRLEGSSGRKWIHFAAIATVMCCWPSAVRAHPNPAPAHTAGRVGGTAPAARLANLALLPLHQPRPKVLTVRTAGSLAVTKSTKAIASPADDGSTVITPQGSAGTQVADDGAGTFTITGGTTVGHDLLHSFATFNLLNSDTADFLAAGNVTTIVARVTGGPSTIDGTLTAHLSSDTSKLHSASLVLINPAGVMFTGNAALDLGGSFAVTTANAVRLSDGLQINASASSPLSVQTSQPAGFDFANNLSAAVTLESATLAVPDGQVFTVAAGSISMDSSEIDAYGGRVNLVAVPTSGTVNLDSESLGSSLTVPVSFATAPASASAGSIAISGGSLVIVNSTDSLPAGAINVNAASLTMTDDDTGLNARSVTSLGGGSVTVNLSGAFSVDGGDSASDGSGIFVTSAAGGNAGTVVVNAGSMSLVNGGEIYTNATSTGSAGTMTVIVHGSATIDDGNSGADTGLFSQSNPSTGSGGPAGRITFTSQTLTLNNGGTIDASTYGLKPAGTVSVTVSGLLQFSGTDNVATVSAESDSSADVTTHPKGGDAGTVDVTAGSIQLDGSSSIDADSYTSGRAGTVQVTAGSIAITQANYISADANATGNAGNVNVTVSGNLSLSGDAMQDEGAISADSLLADPMGGAGGTVTVNAGNLSLMNSYISTDTSSMNPAGTVTVNVKGTLLDDGQDSNVINGITSLTNQTSAHGGKAGDVMVTAQTLTLKSGAEIASDTKGSGDAGNVNVRVSGLLTVDDQGLDQGTSITSDSLAAGKGTGAGGNVTVTAGSISILNLGEIASSTSGSGNGGMVEVTVTGLLTINGGGSSVALTGVSAQTNTGATGAAGSVTVSAGAISILNLGAIGSNTLGSGNGGMVEVTASGLLMIDGNGSSGGFTGVSAESDRGATGAAGNVTVTAGSISILNLGVIGSDTFGSGNGGMVEVTATGLLMIDGSGSSGGLTGVSASSNPGATGAGGSLKITSGTMTIMNGGDISAGTFGSGAGGLVSVTVTGLTTIDGSQLAGIFTGISAQCDPGSTGAGGNVTLSSGSMTILDGGQIGASTYGSGTGGSVLVHVDGLTAIDGDGSAGGLTGILANTGASATGAGGDVHLSTGSLQISNAGEIGANTSGSGAGGMVSVTVAGPAMIDGTGPTALFTGIAAESAAGATGHGGNVTFSADSLEIFNRGEISAGTFGSGAGGNVILNVSGAATIDEGITESSGFTGVSADSNPGATGAGGSISAYFGSLTLQHGGRIAARTYGPGTGGKIDVRVASALVLDAVSTDTTDAAITATSLQTTPGGGAGGTVSIFAGSVMMTGGTFLSTTTSGTGAAGDVTLDAGSILFQGSSGAGVATGSGIFSRSTLVAADEGPAGDVTVVAGSLSLMSGGVINTETSGGGKGGSITVYSGSCNISGADAFGNASSIRADTLWPTLGAGIGGDVKLNVTGALQVNQGGQITAASSGAGKAGGISIDAGSILLNTAGSISSASSGSGDAGSITIDCGEFDLRHRSMVLVSSSHTGSNAGDVVIHSSSNFRLTNHSIVSATAAAAGGDITLDAPGLIYISSSSITAKAGGSGGGITIDPQLVVLTGGSVINGLSGKQPKPVIVGAEGFLVSTDSRILTVFPRFAVDDTVASTVGRLPGDVAGSGITLSDQCGVPFKDDNLSSFVITGRGGTPVEPGGWSPSADLSDGETHASDQRRVKK